jgi:hypothetical protein
VSNQHLKPGEVFNPWHGDDKTPGCGFYAPDIVGMDQSLGDGRKRLYKRLVRFAGGNGECFPSQETLAELLGKSDRQIRSDLKALEGVRLIEHQNRGARRPNTNVFLWHKSFESHSKAPLLSPAVD